MGADRTQRQECEQRPTQAGPLQPPHPGEHHYHHHRHHNQRHHHPHHHNRKIKDAKKKWKNMVFCREGQ